MKDPSERRILLLKRVLEAISSKDFKHTLRHHTDLPIHRIERIGCAVWITLTDGSYYKIEPHISLSPVKLDIKEMDDGRCDK